MNQPNSTAVWTEEEATGIALDIIEVAFVNDGNGCYEIRELAAGEDPALLLLDQGNNAYETVATSVNTNADPELGLIEVGGAAIITYE